MIGGQPEFTTVAPSPVSLPELPAIELSTFFHEIVPHPVLFFGPEILPVIEAPKTSLKTPPVFGIGDPLEGFGAEH